MWQPLSNTYFQFRFWSDPKSKLDPWHFQSLISWATFPLWFSEYQISLFTQTDVSLQNHTTLLSLFLVMFPIERWIWRWFFLDIFLLLFENRGRWLWWEWMNLGLIFGVCCYCCTNLFEMVRLDFLCCCWIYEMVDLILSFCWSLLIFFFCLICFFEGVFDLLRWLIFLDLLGIMKKGMKK